MSDCFTETQYLSTVIDLTRVNIFNVATQYRAVFTDDEVMTKQNDMKYSVFYSWLNKRVCSKLNSCVLHSSK